MKLTDEDASKHSPFTWTVSMVTLASPFGDVTVRAVFPDLGIFVREGAAAALDPIEKHELTHNSVTRERVAFSVTRQTSKHLPERCLIFLRTSGVRIIEPDHLKKCVTGLIRPGS
jgi:hypothetical protein